MARRFYEPVGGGTTLNLFIDPEQFTEAGDQVDLNLILEFQALTDTARAEVAACRGFPDLQSFDADLQDREWELRDRLDYYSYGNRQENITVRDGTWFSPEAVEAFCGEDVSDPAADSIDGDTNTFWRHGVDERHSITYRIRSYPKRFQRIRFRYGVAESARERLTNLDVRVSRDLSEIDEPRNLRESGINIVWPTPGGVWVEHVLPERVSQARYVKLEFDVAAGSGQGQVREFEVFVETRAP